MIGLDTKCPLVCNILWVKAKYKPEKELKEKNVKKFIQFYFWDYLYFCAAFQMEHQIYKELCYVEKTYLIVHPDHPGKTVHPASSGALLSTGTAFQVSHMENVILRSRQIRE